MATLLPRVVGRLVTVNRHVAMKFAMPTCIPNVVGSSRFQSAATAAMAEESRKPRRRRAMEIKDPIILVRCLP